MRRLFMILAVFLTVTPAAAQDREAIGMGRLFTNDYFGDSQDRWRTGSYTLSIVRGPAWSGQAPETFGALLEYRLRSEIIAPARLNGAGSDDRAYVGALTAGVHSHIARGDWDLSAGLDLVVTGPQTGLARAQDRFHDLVSAPSVGTSVQQNQIGNAVHPTLVAEAGYTLPLAPATTLRPFAELQYGVEDFMRVGADILIGEAVQSDLWLRDGPSGQLYSGVFDGEGGMGFALGADYTRLADSAYFPSSFGTIATEDRLRLRAGVHGRFATGATFFYGLSYLSEEFEGQPEGQILGSLKLNFSF